MHSRLLTLLGPRQGRWLPNYFRHIPLRGCAFSSNRTLMKPVAISNLFTAMATAGLLAAPSASKEGTLLFDVTEGDRRTEFRLAVSGQALRIEQLGESASQRPVNLVDLKTGNIMILKPYNRAVSTFPAAAFEPRNPASPPPGFHRAPGPMPQIPQCPAGVQPGVSGTPGGMPSAPPMPQFPGMERATGELVEHAEQREIQGFECRRHTLLLDRTLELTLWLTKHPDLPPFYLPLSDGPPRFGPRDLQEEWPAIVRRSGKFPMLVELGEAPRESPMGPKTPSCNGSTPAQAPERRVFKTWKIAKITPEKPDPGLFGIPQGYFHDDRPNPAGTNPKKESP